MKTLFGNILFAAFAFLALSAEECGETHYISDSGFDLWCDDSLCDWDVLSGSVARAASWHKADFAVELLGEDVVITQLSTRPSTSCLRFEVLADIDDDARVTLSIDYFDDGIVEYEQELGHVRWESLVHLVSTPASWRGVRFTLRKEGPGRARLAQIEATADDACIDKPIEFPDKPLGASCLSGAECDSGTCAASPVDGTWFGSVCSTCDADTECEAGFVCGTALEARSFLLPARGCVPEASRELGALCIVDSECGTGVCCDARCSECCEGQDCVAEVACAPAAVPDVLAAHAPRLCAGGDAGALCTSGADCVSETCNGTGELLVCAADGRDCTASSDCPIARGALEPQCLAIGIVAGTCS